MGQELVLMIMECKNCKKKNRIPDDYTFYKDIKCGNCKSVISLEIQESEIIDCKIETDNIQENQIPSDFRKEITEQKNVLNNENHSSKGMLLEFIQH